MTTRCQHEQQAKDNLELHEHLVQGGRHLDWAVTTLFYAALHYVDAFLLPDDPKSHHARNRRIRDRVELRAIWGDYRLRQERSRDARYECARPTRAEVRTYRTRHFEPIQARLAGLLRPESSS